jgi:multiple sugar transport system ATP-binding protein
VPSGSEPGPGASGPDGKTGLVDVTVALGGVPVLHDVTLLAGPREVLAVLGPSGSGKTTMLRTVAGFEPVVSGDVYVAGRRCNGVPTSARDVAMVFQDGGLDPTLDVAANMARGLRMRGTPEPEVADRLAGRGRRLGLGRLMGRRPRTLSRGERGRVEIGRALVREPRAFLFDEPLAHLDAADRVRARLMITEMVARVGAAALYATHDPAEAMAIGDRLAVLRAGRVVQHDRPIAVYRRPADLFVAGLVGQPPLGLLPARLVATDAGAGFRVGNRTLPLWRSLPAALAGYVGRPVLLGLRAEDVAEAGPATDPGSVTLPATVAVVEVTGPEARVAVRIDERWVDEVRADAAPAPDVPGRAPDAPLWARFDPRTAVRPGDRVRVAVDAGCAHVFDPATERALHHPDG